MSIYIDLNKKEILHVKNSIFETLHDAISNIIEKNNLNLADDIKILLEKTDQYIYGSGAITADIANYLKNKNSVLIFADLVKQAIESKYDYFNHFEGCIEHLWNFYHELINYANELKN